MKTITDFTKTPIRATYLQPSYEFIIQAKQKNTPQELIDSPGILVENYYLKNSIRGAMSRVYLRLFLVERLQEALKPLLCENYGFVIFDAYRSKQTQAGLFSSYFDQIKSRHPDWSDEALHQETRKYVAHPDEPSRFEVPPHNSGGAVDIGLTFKGKPVDMGTGFDDLTEKASTNYFEKDHHPECGIDHNNWENIRRHRRILFHSLTSVGFTNWQYEWWHFDIGNCVWAQELQLPWIYDSMDGLIKGK